VIDALLDLPSHLRERLASALESGLLSPSPTPASFRSVQSVGSEGGKARPEFTPLQRRSAIALPLRL
jgi:hypothetical protein